MSEVIKYLINDFLRHATQSKLIMKIDSLSPSPKTHYICTHTYKLTEIHNHHACVLKRSSINRFPKINFIKVSMTRNNNCCSSTVVPVPIVFCDLNFTSRS